MDDQSLSPLTTHKQYFIMTCRRYRGNRGRRRHLHEPEVSVASCSLLSNNARPKIFYSPLHTSDTCTKTTHTSTSACIHMLSYCVAIEYCMKLYRTQSGLRCVLRVTVREELRPVHFISTMNNTQFPF